MDSATVILDVSSDDDLGWVDDVRFDLIDEFLNEQDESDDVVVLGEIPPRSAASRRQNHRQLAVKSGDRKARWSQNHRNVVADGDGDDDDCLILDGDPDKAVAVDNGEAKESDELVVVAEKGQLACRDYPHPRHLCATYPFKTTPHQKHCNLCHCYVCDSIAPCKYWDTGVSNHPYHCHATDKEEIWKVRRQGFKQGKITPSLAPKQLGTALSMAVPQHNSSTAVAPSRPVNHGSLSRSLQSQPNALNPCSSYSFPVPNIISQKSDRNSGVAPQIISPMKNVVHHANQSRFSRHTVTTSNNVVRRSTTVPYFTPPHANFKRVGTSAVTWTKNQTGCSASFGNSANQKASLSRNYCSQFTTHGTRNQDFLVGSNSQSTHQSSSHPCTGSSSVEFHPCSNSLQPQICSQPDSLLDRDLSVHPQNSCQSSSQPVMGSDSLDFHWIDASTPGVPLNLSDYNWCWFPETFTDATIPATENTFQPTLEPPPENNPDPGLPYINDTSTEILHDCWNEPPDQNNSKVVKDAEIDQFMYDLDLIWNPMNVTSATS